MSCSFGQFSRGVDLCEQIGKPPLAPARIARPEPFASPFLYRRDCILRVDIKQRWCSARRSRAWAPSLPVAQRSGRRHCRHSLDKDRSEQAQLEETSAQHFHEERLGRVDPRSGWQRERMQRGSCAQHLAAENKDRRGMTALRPCLRPIASSL